MDVWETADWSAEAQEEFWAAVGRKRQHRLNAIRRKSTALIETGEPDKVAAGRELREEIVSTYLEERDAAAVGQRSPKVYKRFVLHLLEDCAEEAERDGDLASALGYWEQWLEIFEDDYAEAPWSMQTLLRHVRMLRLDGRDTKERLEAIERDPRTSEHHLRQLAFAWEQAGYGERAAAVKERLKRYELSQIVPYETLAEREVLSVDGDEYPDPDAAAEPIVVYHHAEIEEVFTADAAAVRALQAICRPRRGHPEYRVDFYRDDFLYNRFVPQLGAYLGRVLVESYGGEWVAKDPLMTSRVKLGDRLVDPFAFSYDFVFHEEPLVKLLEVADSEA